MKIEIDTHTHTLVSGHAYSTMNEMAVAAREKGLKGIALTEHAPLLPGSPHFYYFQNLKVVPREKCGIRLFLGVELNILNQKGEVDLAPEILEILDLRIASIHVPCYEGERTVDAITEAYLRAMENPNIDIIGHPDDGRFPINYYRLVQGAVATGTILEVNNTSLSPESFRQNGRENILNLLQECKAQGAFIALGTDAHVDTAIGEYPYVMELLKESDFPEELVVNTSIEKLEKYIKK
ncbi:putative hydrolase [Aequitasia blattaphilus]|uniref:Phosphatase n=1 Tax=Aequitasia blattaphilus TaxID=2949332 RepID=A0ABT1E927_9FIRM|nr:phosphatase [Aequitasia blattaphilus]MCP1102323.1 phosphatase [Aequitasia blattaphilus]MCR8614963.1 phosphatase [Aequitasia blattaphilus]